MRKLLVIFFIILSTTVLAQSVLVTAHRGASAYAPENTLAAVAMALEIGVDRVEVDVQQTADGVVVCLHDKTLDRTTNGSGKVGDKTWIELQDIKANKEFEEEFPNEGVPSLKQVFELFDGSTQFVIEIKDGRQRYPGIEDKVAKLIKENNAQTWAVVHSFNDRVLEYLDDNHPDIRLQKLFVSKPSWLPLMLDFRLHFASLSDYSYVEAFGISRSGTSKQLVKKAHLLGKKVHVWTVNEIEDMEQMIELGVDGLISNSPDKVKDIINRK